MRYEEIFYPESKFGGFPDGEETITFYTRVNSLVNPSSVILDIGCGRGVYEDSPTFGRKLQILKGKVKKVIGIDVDERGKENKFIDEFRRITGSRWPVENESVDLCLSDCVLEHVQDPDVFFSECARVTKEGGYLCLKTPNLLGYVGMISRLIPSKYHSSIMHKMRPEGQVAEHYPEVNHYPTAYKCNTVWRLRKILDKYGFESRVYGFEANPCYLSSSKLFYLLGVLHQKLAPSALKVSLFAFARKKRRTA